MDEHISKFNKMVDFCKQNGINAFGYGDLWDDAENTKVFHQVVDALRNQYGFKHIDYTNDTIFYYCK